MAKLTFDLDLGRFVSPSGTTAELETLHLQRCAGEILRIELVRGEVEGIQLTGTPSFQFICKQDGKFSNEALVLADEFVYDEDSDCYVGTVNLITAPLDALLLVGEVGEKAELSVDGQFALREADDEPWQHSQVLDVTVHNSVHRGDEVPAVISGFAFSMDGDGNLIFTYNGQSYWMQPFTGTP